MNSAIERLKTQFAIAVVPDQQIALKFSLKCPKKITKGIFDGHHDGAWVDAYVACIDEEIPIERLHLDVRATQSAKYVTLAELQAAYEGKDESFVHPTNDEYVKKLIHHLKKTCKTGGVL